MPDGQEAGKLSAIEEDKLKDLCFSDRHPKFVKYGTYGLIFVGGVFVGLAAWWMIQKYSMDVESTSAPADQF